MTPAAIPIAEQIARQSQRTPDALAILAPGRAPLTVRGLTERVARYFEEVLGCDKVGAFDNFFELGGDSLHGARRPDRPVQVRERTAG